MSKIDEARDVLAQFGLPPAQRNDISCLTLLALAGLSEDDAWSEASGPSRTTHQLLGFMRDIYGRDYAENTRETVRRRVIRQFEQARLVDRNPDDPDLPTNSPRSHYGLTAEALNVLRLYHRRAWDSELRRFRSRHRALTEVYRRRQRMREIPIRTSTGEEIRLSPGRHNRLQALVISDFGPRFAPGSLLLYLGDAARKLLHLDREKLDRLGTPLTEHDKLPDVVFHDEERNRLFVVETVTSHGPMSPERVEELEIVLTHCVAARLYVSAFPDFRQFKRHADKIAWETEVWIAESPDHLIHFNGNAHLGPRENTRVWPAPRSLRTIRPHGSIGMNAGTKRLILEPTSPQRCPRPQLPPSTLPRATLRPSSPTTAIMPPSPTGRASRWKWKPIIVTTPRWRTPSATSSTAVGLNHLPSGRFRSPGWPSRSLPTIWAAGPDASVAGRRRQREELSARVESTVS